MTKDQYNIKLNKSTHIGASILELRKLLMYNFRYDYIKTKYIVVTYEIETVNVYESFNKGKENCRAPIKGFVGLRAKMNPYLKEEEHE